MEVRAGARPASSLYSGTLEQGQTQALHEGRRCSSRSPSRGNVVVRLNGERVTLPRTGGLTFVVTRGGSSVSGVLSRRPRAAIVVTGSELVRGERTDRNGPFLAREALALGLEPERIVIVGDDPDGSRGARCERRIEADLCLVSGGLGPTHDDRTVELVARVAGRDARRRRGARAADRGRLARGRGAPRPPVRRLRDRACASRRRCPRARSSLGLAGTAPGLVLDARAAASSSCCPARRASCGGSGRARSRREPVRRVLARAPPPGRAACCASSARRESAVAAGARGGRRRRRRGGGDDLRARLRDPRRPRRRARRRGARRRARRRAARARSSATSSREDERTDRGDRARALPRARADARDRRVVHGRARRRAADGRAGRERRLPRRRRRLRERGEGARSSASREDVLEEHGAVSAEVAAAMAAGVRDAARRRTSASRSPGVAGPGGGSAGEAGRARLPPRRRRRTASEARRIELPGDREMIRGRATVAALHLVRRVVDTKSARQARDLGAVPSRAMSGSGSSSRSSSPGDASSGLERVGQPSTSPADGSCRGSTSTSRSPSSAAGRAAELERDRRRAPRGGRGDAGRSPLEPVALPRDAVASGCSSSTIRAARRRALAERAAARGSRSSASTERERRPWLPHVTVLRFRERPRLDPPLPELGNVRSVRRRCFPIHVCTRPGRGTRCSNRVSLDRRRMRSMNREEALDVALGQIERQFGKGSVMRMSDRPQVVDRRDLDRLALARHRARDRRAAARAHRRDLRPRVVGQDDARLPRDRRGAAPRRHLRLHRRRARDGPAVRAPDRRRHRRAPRLAARHGRAGARDRRAPHPLRRARRRRGRLGRRARRRRRRSRARWATATSACRRG